ncbi:MAG: stage II sporulation protein D [Clostridiales bacterium]|nr:stage II sporulation protein D [Clostridiales bacterium]
MLLISSAILIFVIFSLIILPLLLITIVNNDELPNIERLSIDIPVKVYLHKTGDTVTLDLEEYVAGVVAGEMPSSFEFEALKAQAVAARTYALSKVVRGEKFGNSADHPNAPLCDDTHCQVYRSEQELLELKGSDWMKNSWPKIKDAVATTLGEVMFYGGELVEQPLYHSSSGGKTENSEDVFVSNLPYLRSVESKYEDEAPHQSESISISFNTFKEKIQNTYGASSINPNTIKILKRSEGGRVEEIQVGDKTLKGRDIRELFNLRSANFTFAFDGNNNIVFTTRGFGHGVGMSQWGANGMAQAGFNYKEILKHYYTGVTVKQVN